MLLADLLGDTGKIDQAIEILNKAVKNEPDNASYKFALGGILTKFGRNDEAIKVFQDIIKRFSSNDEVVKLAHSSLSIIYVNQGDYAKGEAELESSFRRSRMTRGSITTSDTSTRIRARTWRRPNR